MKLLELPFYSSFVADSNCKNFVIVKKKAWPSAGFNTARQTQNLFCRQRDPYIGQIPTC